MARRSGFRKGRRGGKSNIVMKGLFGSKIPFGIIGLVAAGYIYSRFVSPMVPKMIPMQSSLTESAVIGGLPMAAGSFLAGQTSGGNGSDTSGAAF